MHSLRQLVFVHVNKCGGKSLDIALREYAAQHGIVYSEVHGLVSATTTPPVATVCSVRCPLSPPVATVLFVRDPIERFISSFKFAKTRRYLLGYNDINELVDAMRTSSSIRERLFALNEHFGYSLSRYINATNGRRNTQWTFVGTTENIAQDYIKLLDCLDTFFGIVNTRDNHRPILGHYHRTNSNKRKVLSAENIAYLRDVLYKDDYVCLSSLVDRGYLPKEYLNNALHRQDYVY